MILSIAFFSLLKPGYFELVFRDWVCELCSKYEGFVVIDGKMLRRASKCCKDNPFGKKGFKLHMVSVWAVSNGISMGQVKVDDNRGYKIALGYRKQAPLAVRRIV